MDETENPSVTDFPFEAFEKNFLIHAVEKLSDVRTPDVTVRILSQKILRPFNRSKKPFALTARPGIVYKGFVENRNEIVIQKPVNHPVTDSGNGNLTPFVITNYECLVGSVTVNSATKIALKIGKILFKIKLEGVQFSRHVFAFFKAEPALPNIF
jgi:hypothetical protein